MEKIPTLSFMFIHSLHWHIRIDIHVKGIHPSYRRLSKDMRLLYDCCLAALNYKMLSDIS